MNKHLFCNVPCCICNERLRIFLYVNSSVLFCATMKCISRRTDRHMFNNARSSVTLSIELSLQILPDVGCECDVWSGDTLVNGVWSVVYIKKYVPYWIIIPRRVYLLDVEWITTFIVIETKNFVGFRLHTRILKVLANNLQETVQFSLIYLKFILTYVHTKRILFNSITLLKIMKSWGWRLFFAGKS